MTKLPNLVFMTFPNMSVAIETLHHLGGLLDMMEFGTLINNHVSLLAGCEENPLKNFEGPLPDSVFIKEPPENLLKAIFHQQKVKVTSHLLVIETKTMADLLKTCDQLLKKTQFELIDIQRNTGFGHTAYLANDPVSDVKQFAPWDASFKVIAHPSAALLKYFNI
jgi:hypothetical protein